MMIRAGLRYITIEVIYTRRTQKVNPDWIGEKASYRFDQWKLPLIQDEKTILYEYNSRTDDVQVFDTFDYLFEIQQYRVSIIRIIDKSWPISDQPTSRLYEVKLDLKTNEWSNIQANLHEFIQGCYDDILIDGSDEQYLIADTMRRIVAVKEAK